MAKKKHKIFYALAFAVVAVIAAAALWLKFSGSGEVRSALLKILPYPLATVGQQTIYMKDYLARLGAAEKISAGQGISEQDLKQQVYGRMVYESQAQQLAEKYGLTASPEDVEREYEYLLGAPTAATNSAPQILAQYGLSTDDYKQEVVKPELTLVRLQIYYNSQKDLVPDAYGKLEQAKAELAAGQSFAQAARDFSEDPRTAATGGDAGFVKLSGLQPEIAEAVASAQPGDTELVVSRLGLHYISIGQSQSGQDGDDSVELKQIFFQTSGFDQWFTEQAKNFPVKQLSQL